ncbi:hypothetical protein [Niveispirillum cyanobacteriorum]|uniref:hypothetical protein n=1 Tax=Niveispirillum cyanobacteriorum TaxID=1612173 RepID=UPI00131A235D|nr:hypothetical protein [Niveispirillum cyanobacteriorum]
MTELMVSLTIPSSSVMSLMAIPATSNIECGKPERIMLTLMEIPLQRNPEFHQN